MTIEDLPTFTSAESPATDDESDSPSYTSRISRSNNSRHAIVLLITLLVSSVPAYGSTYISVGDEAYVLLSRLEAEGVISDAILSAKPLSRKEIVRLALAAEENAAGRSEFIKGLVQALKRRVQADEYAAGTVKPVESVYAAYISTNAGVRTLIYPGAAREQEQAFNYNNDGDLYGRGSNYRAGLTSRLENIGPLSVYLNPEYRSADDGAKGVLKQGYAVLGFSWIDIVAGKDSQWWGPGYHGALLLSNNAEPMTMVKAAGPEPQVLPWVFKYLGPFQYNLFVAGLDKGRSDYPEPYFWGMRLAFKPHRYLEIGLERTAIVGGGGRPTDGDIWINSILGGREHGGQNPGDQRAGFDVKATLPFELQPVQLYWEQAGEENRQRNSRRPYKLANLYGVYLPRVLGFERIDVRAEYARNQVNEQPFVWYTHGVYSAGYTYQGMVIGHHMGTESQDQFLELSCLVPERSARFLLSYDRETHTIPGSPLPEITNEVILSAVYWISRHREITASYGIGTAESGGNRAGAIGSSHEFKAGFKYLF